MSNKVCGSRFCDFWGVVVLPNDMPFLHVNDRLKIATTHWVLRIITWIQPLFVFLAVTLPDGIVSSFTHEKTIQGLKK
jgi:hypothetical protein